MGKNSTEINAQNINEWLAPLGYLFPKNPLELEQFEMLYANYDYKLTNHKVDINAIISSTRVIQTDEPKFLGNIQDDAFDGLRMAARKGEAIPKEILEKMKKNQRRKRDEK